MSFGNSHAESQRDSGLQPRVARNDLPWKNKLITHNPNGVAAPLDQRDATPLGLKTSTAITQGSSFLATLVCSISRFPGWRQLVAIQPVATSRRHPDPKPLGWRTQSRWDWRNRWNSRSATHTAVRLLTSSATGKAAGDTHCPPC